MNWEDREQKAFAPGRREAPSEQGCVSPSPCIACCLWLNPTPSHQPSVRHCVRKGLANISPPLSGAYHVALKCKSMQTYMDRMYGKVWKLYGGANDCPFGKRSQGSSNAHRVWGGKYNWQKLWSGAPGRGNSLCDCRRQCGSITTPKNWESLQEMHWRPQPCQEEESFPASLGARICIV